MTGRASDYEEGVAKLERELAFARRNGAKAVKELHRLMVRELRGSERRLEKARARASRLKKRLERAEAEAAAATSRAERAERELSALRASTSWRVGRAVVALPSRLRRR